jgi:CheY-like chemotaxis protein
LEESELPRSERATLNNVRRATDAMEDLFNALLDVSKLDAGIVLANTAVVPLAPILDRVFAEYLPVAQAKGLRLRKRYLNLYVKTDPMLFERIVRNLVSNAVRYTPAGSVLLACRSCQAGVRVEVWDTGPGIPPDKHEEIFREFYQLGNPERDRSKGLGLGLAIVDRLSKLLNHPIALRTKIGRGSMFSVWLPSGNPREYVPVQTSAQSFVKVDLQGKWVVVVDDEMAVQQGMESLLRKWLCEVTVAGSWAEMQQRLADSTRVPDLIISDYRLRDNENGIQVVQAIRNEFNTDIPALLITGDTGPERLREAQASGLPLLHKPLSPARLRTLMASLLAEDAPATA